MKVGVGTAATLLLCALAVVAAGSLLPSVEDWVGARRELRLIEPLMREMERRQPDVGIGVRPRGPLVFRVAERLSTISDALYLEAINAQTKDDGGHDDAEPAGMHALHALAWCAFDYIGLGLVLRAQSQGKFLVRHYLKHYHYPHNDRGQGALHEAFQNWKQIYNTSMCMMYGE